MELLLTLSWLVLCGLSPSFANPDAKRLYDDLLSNYNRLIRPVGNNSDRLTVKMGLRLSQLIDVNLKNQIMTTNVWVEQEWNDYKLKWNPDDYGGVETLHVPSEHIWLPDIVLYNNADGNYEVTIMTKAILHHTGKVIWKPPAIYKSFCEIDVEYFPFDEQTCFMKFGSWTYDGYMVDLRHLSQVQDSNKIDMGIDLQDYYISVEWDIMRVPAVRNEKFYSCCEEPYPDIIFNITLRRKTLFYTVNLIIPCVGISFLSILVFYLPSDSGEKVSLSISILLSLTVFFLLLVEIIPPTSLTVPLLGKYLLFTMLLCTLSVVITIIVLNVNFRSPVTHKLAPWVRGVFIDFLPKFLFIDRPKKDDDDNKGQDSMLTDVIQLPMMDKCKPYEKTSFDSFDLGLPPPRFEVPPSCFGEPPFPLPLTGGDEELYSPASCRTNTFDGTSDASPSFEKLDLHDMEKTIADSRFIAQHVRNKDSFENVEEDWKYVAMVMDRLFLWIFTVACIVGTGIIIFNAPSLYDTTKPIDVLISKVAKKKMALLKMVPEEL
ncbi:acetylcholine receptor subunit alpha-like 1 [Aethina tumida]|uniref:acetylcholine receptor subunit alpha-like 1 n=1 Tax=Aethina tumida TaxID=116153 RepID=UPI00096B5C81|nr:acetylcholine receptor subunit alpha-like 1 [Aethina tumida]